MLENARKTITAVLGQLRRGIIGQDAFLHGLLTGVLADGHILIEGVPGLGKTRAVNLLSRVCDVAFKRSFWRWCRTKVSRRTTSWS